MGRKWFSKSAGVEGFFVMEPGNSVEGVLMAFNDDPGGDAGPFFILELSKECPTAKVKNERGEKFDDKAGDYRIETLSKGALIGVSRITDLKGLEEEVGAKIKIECTGTRKARTKGHADQKLCKVEILEEA
jgi:hypothetical protein